jgi:hypothetical protein
VIKSPTDIRGNFRKGRQSRRGSKENLGKDGRWEMGEGERGVRRKKKPFFAEHLLEHLEHPFLHGITLEATHKIIQEECCMDHSIFFIVLRRLFLLSFFLLFLARQYPLLRPWAFSLNSASLHLFGGSIRYVNKSGLHENYSSDSLQAGLRVP